MAELVKIEYHYLVEIDMWAFVITDDQAEDPLAHGSEPTFLACADHAQIKWRQVQRRVETRRIVRITP